MRHRTSIKITVILFGIFSLLVTLLTNGFCEVPQRISYQGELTDDLGNTLDGNFVMVFTI